MAEEPYELVGFTGADIQNLLNWLSANKNKVGIAKDVTDNAGVTTTNVDCDLMLIPGFYRFSSGVTITNGPDITRAFSGLIVEEFPRINNREYSMIRQTIFNNNFGSDVAPGTEEKKTIYVRYRKDTPDGRWTHWRYILTSIDIDADELESDIEDIQTELSYAGTSKLEYATKINSTSQNPADYNSETYRTPGDYYVQNGSTAATILNSPVTSAHRLYVIETAPSRITQLIITIAVAPAVQIYKRHVGYISSTWQYSKWNRVVDTDNYHSILFGVSKDDLKLVESGADYDDYTTPGAYITPTGVPSTIIHRPPTTARHRLYVLDLTSMTASGVVTTPSNRLIQIAVTIATAPAVQIYKRIRSIPTGGSPTWSDWNTVLDSSNFESQTKTCPNTDFGVIPKGVFYSGIDVDDYDDFGTGVPDSQAHSPTRGNGTDIYNAWPKEIYDKFHALSNNHTEYITEWHYTPSENVPPESDVGTWAQNRTALTPDANNILQDQYAFVLTPTTAVHAQVTFPRGIPTIFIISGQHGYEKSSPMSLYYLFKHIVENTVENPILQYLRRSCRIVCMPYLNHYGCRWKTYTNGAVGPTYISGTSTIDWSDGDSWGVNLNRNWDVMGPDGQSAWVEFTEETMSDPFDNDFEQYTGTRPFSEVETRAARDLFNKYKSSIVLAIDYHTNNNRVLYEYREMNNILFKPDNSDPAKVKFEEAIRYHISNITSQFISQYKSTDDPPVKLIDYKPNDSFETKTVTNNAVVTTTVYPWKYKQSGSFIFSGLCGRINLGSSHTVNTALDWFNDQGVLACTFETFAGFPDNFDRTYTEGGTSSNPTITHDGRIGKDYVPNVLKASEELIANFIVTVLNYIS